MNGGLSSVFWEIGVSVAFLIVSPLLLLRLSFGGVFGSSFVPQTVQNFSSGFISAPQFEHIILSSLLSDFSDFSRIISDGVISFSDGLSGLAKGDFSSDFGGFGEISGVGGTGGTGGIGSGLSNFVPHIIQNLRLPSTDFPQFGQLMFFGGNGLPFIGGFTGGNGLPFIGGFTGGNGLPFIGGFTGDIGLPFIGGFTGGIGLPFIGCGSNLNPQILQNFIEEATIFPQ